MPYYSSIYIILVYVYAMLMMVANLMSRLPIYINYNDIDSDGMHVYVYSRLHAYHTNIARYTIRMVLIIKTEENLYE